MSVQIWVLTVPRLASPRFLHIPPFQVFVHNPDKAYPVQVNVKFRMHAASVQCFRRLSYVLMYPVMFQHR